MADSEDDTNWTIDLESALIDECDFSTISQVCRGRPVPSHLRAEVWQICLNVADKGNELASFDELYDMTEQDILREDCQALVDKLGNDEEEKISVASDLESILTFYCKSRSIQYQRENGWLDVLQPMLALKFNKSDLYNVFYTFVNKFIPRNCGKNGKPFHLFRLLLQYHDPELCSFLDTRKISPDTYAPSWLRSLFASTCDLKVTLNMWDVYLQHSDPFLIFFLALVILVNAKEQLITMKESSREEIIEKLVMFPSALEAEDIEDFCSLAQYYASKTPQSFRKDFQDPLFGTSVAAQKAEEEDSNTLASYALCLPVSATELIRQKDMSDSVRYFVVDCRPADQYNSGHLTTAFHLEANLMLQDPEEFTTAINTLLTAQKQALAAGSAAGGEHLCFLGSGREEEDQYVHMVVARFLHQNSQYVSLAYGGYLAIHECLKDQLSQGVAGNSALQCITSNPLDNANGLHDKEDLGQGDRGDSLIDRFEKLSSVVKSKSSVVKDKVISYIKNEHQVSERHVSSEDRVGKRYRNTQSVFTIGDDEDDEGGLEVLSSDDEHRDTVSIETWLNKPDIKYAYPCQHVKESGYSYNSFLMITDSHLFILREMPNRKGMAWVQSRRALGNVVKITSKKRTPDLITFKYGFSDETGIKVTDLDRLIIPKAAEATKNIRHQILSVLETLDAS